MAGKFTKKPKANLANLLSHLDLLQPDEGDAAAGDKEVSGSPIFTEPVRRYGHSLSAKAFSQYGLIGGEVAKMSSTMSTGNIADAEKDPRIFYNVTAPSSVFICGSQGSGKSHTLSCLLENCLIPCEANVLPHPLCGMVLHYDTFVSDTGGSPCEAAYLSSNGAVKVRVLCPPTNISKIEDIYSHLPNVSVEALRIDEQDLNTQRMLDLMAISSVQGGGMPLYLHVVTRILRDLRIKQQVSGGGFNYAAFKRALLNEDLAPGQMAPLQQRLDTLESFMVKPQVLAAGIHGKQKAPKLSSVRGNSWRLKAGHLTIVDLSCPCVTPDAACALFNICVSMFLEQKHNVGRVIALDEAHKYMTESEGSASAGLTETLLSTIRLQRHQGTRVIISTQEPTVSPKLLDLCSVTVAHRFTSPDWLRSLKRHLAADRMLDAAEELAASEHRGGAGAGLDVKSNQKDAELELFSKILALRQGEALLFAPGAVINVSQSGLDVSGSDNSESDASGSDESDSDASASDSSRDSRKLGKKAPVKSRETAVELETLGLRAMKIRVRKRVTEDGGRTVMAG